MVTCENLFLQVQRTSICPSNTHKSLVHRLIPIAQVYYILAHPAEGLVHRLILPAVQAVYPGFTLLVDKNVSLFLAHNVVPFWNDRPYSGRKEPNAGVRG